LHQDIHLITLINSVCISQETQRPSYSNQPVNTVHGNTSCLVLKSWETCKAPVWAK